MAKKQAKKDGPMVVVASRVKDCIRDMDLRSDGALPEAVNAMVLCALKKAAERAKSNKRGTVRPYDL
jgi:hypothetical protein